MTAQVSPAYGYVSQNGAPSDQFLLAALILLAVGVMQVL